MSTLLAFLLAVLASAALLLVYFITRSSYSNRAASAEAVAAQITAQSAQQAGELDTVRRQLAGEQELRARAEATLEGERKSLIEQKRILGEAEQKLSDVFEGLASKALTANATDFVNLANTTLKSGAVKDLQNLVQPIQDTLSKYQMNLSAIEDKRLAAYSALSTTLGQVSLTQETLRNETSNLVSALRRPNVRGRWGELTLRRVAELTGMSEHCDFDLQTPVAMEEGGSIRPDMIVRLPKGMIVPVDSKVPLDQYLDALAASSEADRNQHLKKHAIALRERMETLAAKGYAAQFPVNPDVTVLFLPSDAFLSAALEFDRTLLEDAMGKKVVIATPVSLFCLLKSVAYGWQQDAIAENAQAISALGKELYGRIAILWGHLDNLRDSLVSSISAFDATVGSLESRVLPSVRRFKELGSTTEGEIEVLEKIGREPRALRLSAMEIKTVDH